MEAKFSDSGFVLVCVVGFVARQRATGLGLTREGWVSQPVCSVGVTHRPRVRVLPWPRVSAQMRWKPKSFFFLSFWAGAIIHTSFASECHCVELLLGVPTNQSKPGTTRNQKLPLSTKPPPPPGVGDWWRVKWCLFLCLLTIGDRQ